MGKYDVAMWVNLSPESGYKRQIFFLFSSLLKRERERERERERFR
jgi:hypothetical protein